jgi:MarR family transcriptional regulator, transcriptional regulator for hemolysin
MMNTSTLIKKASTLLVKKANDLLKPYGITHAYTYFLMELFEQDGLTQSEMHKRIGIEQPTAVRTLDRMERDGLIIRNPSPTDRRAISINLTDKARQYQQIIEQCALELNRIALDTFTNEEKTVINQLINRLNENLLKNS